MRRPIQTETKEKLLRLRAPRRGTTVELRVHYKIQRERGCDLYRIISVEAE